MIPFGNLYKLLNFCLQELQSKSICHHCLRGLDFNLCLEHAYFNHPVLQFYPLKSTPLRHIIQKRITLVYNPIFFLEESLIQIGNNSTKKLSAAILTLLCELRQAKVFPTADSLFETSLGTVRAETKLIKKILKPKLQFIARLVQCESSYATHLSKCDCQKLVIREINEIKEIRINSIPSLANSLCFECIGKTQCNHRPRTSRNYKFLNLPRNHKFRPICRRSTVPVRK